MRYAFLILISVFGLTSGAWAKDEDSTASATLQLTLGAMKSITLNSAQTTVSIAYSSVSDYEKGTSVTESKHLEISSSGSFNVYTFASGDLTNTSDASKTIPSDLITVQAAYSSDNTNSLSPTCSSIALTHGSLSSSDMTTSADFVSTNKLISSSSGSSHCYFDVTYTTDPTVGGYDQGTYQTTVYYVLTSE